MSKRRRPLAEIEAAAGRPETRGRAIDLAIRALGEGHENPLVLQLVIEGLEADGRLRDAAAMAQRLTEVAPALPEAWTEFSRLLRRFGRPWEALDAARRGLGLDPASYAVQLAATSAFLEVNDFAEAARHAREAADIRGDAVEPPSLLAAIAARRGDFPAAREFADRALALDPDSTTPQVVLAKAHLAEGQAGMAAERLKRLLSRPDLRDARRAEALTALGDALDALDDPGSAFGAYLAAKPAPPRQTDPLSGDRSQTAIEHARSLEAYFRAADPADWAAGAGGEGEAGPGVTGHVFLLGFPRSGTTLLENALASHPSVVALEEADALIRCGGAFLDADGLDRLARLTGDEARACRDIYWARVGELSPRLPAGAVFIDKMPLHTIALPVIARLFPKAKILFSRRDPRDVALSCFRRLSGMNAVTAEFVTIDGAARYYDQVMRLAELYQGLLGLEFHFVRHEDVVAAFDREVGAALEFIGLAWDPAVRDFAARAAGAKTPSAGQLARGLTAEGVGAWKRYAGQMAPALPILAPWVERFGYLPGEADAPCADPRLPAALFEVNAAVRAGDWPRAFPLVDAAFTKGLAHPFFHRLRAMRAQQAGRLGEAIADFETAIAHSPGDFATLSALGDCLIRSGRPAEGLARLDTSIALNPNFAPAHGYRGRALETMGDLAEAREAYGRALAIDPRHALALGALSAMAAGATEPPHQTN